MCRTQDGSFAHLVSQGFEFTARARVEVHELVAVDQQGRLFALVLVLEGCETPALNLQDTGQVPDVALEGQEASPDLSGRAETSGSLCGFHRGSWIYISL